MTPPKIVVHTDLFIEHLLSGTSGPPSPLRLALGMFFCYTTVFNAIELFALARTASEEREVRRSLMAVKLLGLNARGAERYGRRLRSEPALRGMNGLVAGLCRESALPLLTGRPEEFTGARRLVVVPAAPLAARGASARTVMAQARRLS